MTTPRFSERQFAEINVAEQVAVASISDEFPALPIRIIASVVAAYRPISDSPVELIRATRRRIVDALTV